MTIYIVYFSYSSSQIPDKIQVKGGRVYFGVLVWEDAVYQEKEVTEARARDTSNIVSTARKQRLNLNWNWNTKAQGLSCHLQQGST